MSGPEHYLTHRIRVGLPPEQAFELFTPSGETRWVPGWEPRFPRPGPDDTVPGTVFETAADGRVTTWVVIAREAGRRVAYARVTPGSHAGTVEVTLTPAPAGGSDVTVTYQLTGLGGTSAPDLAEFAAGYPAFIDSWQEAIATALRQMR